MSRESAGARADASSQSRYYRPELDVLRFGAFFMVFLSHVVPGDEQFFREARLPAPVSRVIVAAAAGGAFGVDLFFALSSFLITTLLLREHNKCGSIALGQFYIRRILRIWPLYFAFLLLAWPLAKYIVPGESLSPRYLAAFVLLAGNWAYVAWGYPHSVTGPLWSVSIEEQFYLCWPVVMRRFTNHLALAACSLLVISFLTRFVLVSHRAVHPAIWCNTLARLDPIACGALVALLAARGRLALPRWVCGILLLAACLVFTAAGWYGEFAGSKSLVTYPAVAAACVALLVGTLGVNLPTESSRLMRALIYLGRISYGLYIFHWFFVEALAVPASVRPLERTIRGAAALVATVAVAALSYRFFEGPFLRLKERFTRIRSRPV